MVQRLSGYRREDIEGYDALEELALDFVWCWAQNHSADKVWEQLDPGLWDLTHNPWVVLQTVSREKLESALSDETFKKFVNDLIKQNQIDTITPAWFQKNHPNSALKCVAYFSMEFMLSEALPIYSGGLGNVAGDQLKAASDLGVPVIGIGLLYQQGYFRQAIDIEGAQHALYPYNDPGQLPIIPLRKSNGEWLRIEISLPGWSVWIRAWEVRVGKVRLYLLDTNDAVNLPVHRGITSELYGGDKELRIKQELILGIGGWRLLEALGIEPEVCHLNEGHAAFAILERAKCYMEKNKEKFDIALAITKAGNHFTTHTAVPAGFDLFSPTLIEEYLGKYASENLGITLEDLLALGRKNRDDPNEPFNMAYLALRGSLSANAVSMLHGKVSRHIFSSLFPRWPVEEIPICHVTNGVHMPSWNSVMAGNLWHDACGGSNWMGPKDALEKDFKCASDLKIWQMRTEARKSLIDYSRLRLARMMDARGESIEEVERVRHIFDPNTLTLGFARRFATYKRPNMLLYDKERLLRILTNPKRPVQLLISGKAHPADKPGQALIQEWMRFIWWKPEVRAHVIFVSDYDMRVTENLVQGVDLWINTPRRPWEACGTSGMKVLGNGGLNLSELDGWWVEAYSPDVGWALGDGKEHGEDPAWDAFEANTLYDILENQVAPEFYERDKDGVPTAWIKRVKESMSRLTPEFSADRAVRQYTEQHYLPAAEKFIKRSSNKGEEAKKILNWHTTLSQNWSLIRFGEIKIETIEDKHQFEVQAYLNDIDPDFVKMELFAPHEKEIPTIREEMRRVKELKGTPGMYTFFGSADASRPKEDFTARIIPNFPGICLPLECSHILWQK